MIDEMAQLTGLRSGELGGHMSGAMKSGLIFGLEYCDWVAQSCPVHAALSCGEMNNDVLWRYYCDAVKIISEQMTAFY